MARSSRTHVNGERPPHNPLTPRQLTRDEFGRRVENLMLGKGWRQADLARHSGLPKDSVSTYVKGKTLPTPLSLKKLADALGVEPQELLPNHAQSAINDDNPALDIRQSPGDPSKSWLRVNQLVSSRLAAQIHLMLTDPDADTH
ncbi:helix-turn-helix domain-containing protein [Aurantimonas sp. MSK8Z-1]|uniref:helix-turn-helix domain-containing protein n=1 Tax=Mangrovibrevibacter kandeliae TaxID=2968473 RepID=UPI0021172E2E|nr:helix-turn-helix transcriptional regulator [Aurantimonas sp. MSK8Z-1]MCW4115625.1 helix-turn-helix domain-containing protein [Aurantimonas sp. MSK8Z-1]